MQFKNSLILLASIWPVPAVIIAIIVSFLFSGWQRWLMLFIGPVLFLSPCIIFFKQIAYNENMLFVAMMGIAYLFTLVYYPILVITGIVLMIKQDKR